MKPRASSEALSQTYLRFLQGGTVSRGVPGRCVWHWFLLALGHHAMLPAGCGWSGHRSPALKGLSELPPEPLLTRGPVLHTVMPVVAASPGYPLPLPRAAVHAGAAAPWPLVAFPCGLLLAPLLCPPPPPGLRRRLPLLPWSPYALHPVNILHCHHPSALCC